MRQTLDIIGVPVDKVTMAEALEKLKLFLTEDRVHAIYTPNAEIMYDAHKDPHLKAILKQADLLIADGAGVVLASKILGRPLPEKVPGFDLVKNSFGMPWERKIRYFLFGSKPGIAEKARDKILGDYPGVEVVGLRNGYFTPEEDEEIVRQINDSGADILLVALGAPKQEKWIHDHRDTLKVRVCIGCGGTLDVFAGNMGLAPAFFRNNGLEWLYRLYKEPRRYKRMLKLPKYVFLALGAKIRGK